jgi:predicted RecB family nuclease
MMEPITPQIGVAYTQCPRQAFFLLHRQPAGKHNEYLAILEQQAAAYRARYIQGLQGSHPPLIAYSRQAFASGHAMFTDTLLDYEDLQARADGLIRKAHTPARQHAYYEPTLIVGNHTVSKEHRLHLAFLGYVLAKVQGQSPLHGVLITADGTSHRMRLDVALQTIEPMLIELRQLQQLSTQQPPPVMLNKHCPACAFQEKCYAKAKEIDHLSLIQGMSKHEIEHQNKKGIFTVTQYAYTFRARRLRNNAKGKLIIKYSHALKALAIKSGQIYIVHKPEVKLSEHVIFLDVEGLPDQDLYYLIGLVIIRGSSTEQVSLWADGKAQEETIWKQFLDFLRAFESFTLLHYGSYETEFIERMSRKYADTNDTFIKKIKQNTLNLLSLIYANIYFPTYSNGLKEIGKYLGAKWSSDEASGLQSLVWRYKWEETKNDEFKQKLLTYNIEDCLATHVVAQAIINGLLRNDGESQLNYLLAEDTQTDSKRKRFQATKFLFKEMDYINKSAYFDYQREKIYFREKNKKHKSSGKKLIRHPILPRVNQKTVIRSPTECRHCRGREFWKKKKILTKNIVDMKFMQFGIKRAVIRYSTARVKCKSCGTFCVSDTFTKLTKDRYSHQFQIWVVYQLIVLRQSYSRIKESLLRIFKIKSHNFTISKIKSAMTTFYSETCDHILSRLKAGRIICADETKVSVTGITAYVWVFASMEEVLYVYAPTREGDMVRETLKGFKGVLISDYYAAYDSIECTQQKCLIHLMRDMNDDLLDNPFDEQYKNFVKDFSLLLKSIVDTIDRYGLKKYHLAKHKKDVSKFYNKYLSKKYTSAVLAAYQRRLTDNQKKLFTFLDYDDVPWNNNNAEYAIKEFADYRQFIDGRYNEKGIKEYLTLLSVYKTCEYKNIDFLKFLRSEEKDIDKFCGR